MKMRWHWGAWLPVLLLAGCLGSYDAGEAVVTVREETAAPAAEEGAPPLYLYELTDRWNAAAEQVSGIAEDRKFLRFEVSDAGETLIVHRSWGGDQGGDDVILTGYADKDDGRMERIFIRGRQTDFDGEQLRLLLPYYETLIAASNPGLSADERSGLLKTLSLDGDAAALAERSDEDGENTATVRNIRYEVAAIASGEGRTYALVATLKPDCRGESPLSPCDASGTAGEPAAHDTHAPVARTPFLPPDGYQKVEADRFAFAIPDDWQVEETTEDDAFTFRINGEPAGETEILGWFDAESWPDYKPNHSEQTGFLQRDDLLPGGNGDRHLYRIQLIHTKPAADLDPEWKYEETRWYVADREDGCAYGFYFDSGKVDDGTMEAIVSSFRLRGAGE